jgi:YidC/Oxa1 family membrane protein insertase
MLAALAQRRSSSASRSASSLWHVVAHDRDAQDGHAGGKTFASQVNNNRGYSSTTARVASAFYGVRQSGLVRTPLTVPFAASGYEDTLGRQRQPSAVTSQRRGLFGFGKKNASEAIAEVTTSVPIAETLSAAGELAPVAAALASEVVPVASASWPTTAALMYAMEYFHVAHGLEWWLAIIGATVFIRTVTFPLIVMQMKNTAKLQLAKPELESLQSKMKSNPSQDPELAAAYYKEMQQVWKKYDANPFKSFVPILINAPIFISFYFAISKMAAGVPSFQTGGPAMYMDLSIADPTYSLPILSSLSFLASVELGAVEGMQANTQQSMSMKWFLRALSVAMVPLTASFPQGVFVYWITSNTFSGFQTLVTRNKGFKSLVGIPDVSAITEAPADVALGRAQLDQFQKQYGANPTLHKRPPKKKKA